MKMTNTITKNCNSIRNKFILAIVLFLVEEKARSLNTQMNGKGMAASDIKKAKKPNSAGINEKFNKLNKKTNRENVKENI